MGADKVSTTFKKETDEAIMTSELVNEIFNNTNTGLRILKTEERCKQLFG